MNQLWRLHFSRIDLRKGFHPAVKSARAAVASLAIAACSVASGDPVLAGFTGQQGFAIGPSGLDASPSFAAWAPNAIQGIRNGFQPVGNFATDPTAFRTITSFSVRDVIPTSDFNSWRGSASPTGAFAGEYGNLLYNPVDIVDRGGRFSLSQLVFTGVSSDNPGNPNASLLGSTVDFNTFSYNSGRVGIIHNTDGTMTFITSGSGDQLVDELVYRGVGSYDTDLSVAGTGLTPQQVLNAEIAVYDRASPLTFTATYTIYKDSTSRDPGSALFSMSSTIPSAVPEPSSLVLVTMGMLGAIGASRGFRRSAP